MRIPENGQNGFRAFTLAILLVAALALVPVAQADTVDFNPSDGVINPNGGGCNPPSYPGPCPTDTVGNFVLLSFFAPIQNLLVNNVEGPNTWFLESGQFFQQTDIYLANLGPFTVVSFSAGGCNGTLRGYDAEGNPIAADAFEFTGSCLGVGNFTLSPAWTDVTYLVLTANGGVGEPPEFDLANVVIDPEVSTATPEPSSLVLLGTGLLAFVGMAWRRNQPVGGPTPS